MSEYYIMHKDVKVAKILILPKQIKVMELYQVAHFPPHLQKNPTDEAVVSWLNHRIIPKGRYGITDGLKALKTQSRFSLSMKSHGASLSDLYWLKKSTETIAWKEISFYRNGYSHGLGNALFGIKTTKESAYTASPDATTNGLQNKTWRRIKGVDYLFKEGSAPEFREPINEVFGSKVAEQFGELDYVPYRLAKVDGRICSVCENFVSEEEEFVPAFSIFKMFPKSVSSTNLQHLLYCCHKAGIEGAEEFINKMIVFDYIIDNVDRHMGNFGFMRDANTLKFTRPAPLFDNGTSLWLEEMCQENELPQISTKDKKIKEMKSLDFLNLMELNQLTDLLRELCQEINLNEDRRDFICGKFKRRINRIYEIQKEKEKEKEKKRAQRVHQEMSL